jgi:hypothetical protein
MACNQEDLRMHKKKLEKKKKVIGLLNQLKIVIEDKEFL